MIPKRASKIVPPQALEHKEEFTNPQININRPTMVTHFYLNTKTASMPKLTASQPTHWEKYWSQQPPTHTTLLLTYTKNDNKNIFL